MFRENTMIDHQMHNQQELFNDEWNKSQHNILIEGLRSGQNLAELLPNLLGYSEAFKKESIMQVVACSDGRPLGGPECADQPSDPENPEAEKLGLAGSGILCEPGEFKKLLHTHQGEITMITSHDGCGAAALKFAEIVAKGEQLPAGVTTSDELGQYFAKKAAVQLGVKYHHIGQEEFSCPVHNERMLVIDGTAKFNANKVPDFPRRFSSAALGLGASQDYIAKEAAVLAGISLGDHGFDERFTADNPFYIMVIGINQEQLDATIKSLQGLVDKSAGRVEVVGTLAPNMSK
jgi:hypothetical protein